MAAFTLSSATHYSSLSSFSPSRNALAISYSLSKSPAVLFPSASTERRYPVSHRRLSVVVSALNKLSESELVSVSPKSDGAFPAESRRQCYHEQEIRAASMRIREEEQQRAISQLPPKMSNRCKALMRQIIQNENRSVDTMLAAWVKSTKPQRADWLSVLKEIERSNHPLYFEVFEHAFTQDSFEPNIRDYTKIIHAYAKLNMLPQAERALSSMKNRGFVSDQVTLTALVHMYSKAGNLKLAEDTFEEMKSLDVPLDKRSYGSMIMAYIRAGKLDQGEQLLKEMEDQDIYAGREIYKALLRAYSMIGDYRGAQWVFDAMQLAGIVPDVRVCGLLINAYFQSGKNWEACVAFENMRKCGLEPNDKCVALVIGAYEREDKLKEALSLLAELERDGLMLGKESLEVVLKWFQKLGIADEEEVVLRDLRSRMPQSAL